jgi:serine/threonine protein phosphatase PrpC
MEPPDNSGLGDDPRGQVKTSLPQSEDSPPPPERPYQEKPPADLIANLLKFANPAILFELDAYHHQKAYDNLVRMVKNLPDMGGRYDRETEYTGHLGVEGVFKISRVWTNGFFRQEGANESDSPPHDDGTPCPVIFLDDDKFDFKIRKGFWKVFDGPLTLQFVSKNVGDPFFCTFEKEYFVAPDPKSMWKDLRVEDFEGYETEHAASGFLEIPGEELAAVAASLRGRSHANVGKPRDDNFFMKTDPVTGWTAVAVADGAGSSKYSRKGSELACKTSVEKFLALAADVHKAGKAGVLNDAIEDFNKARGSDVSVKPADPRFNGIEGKVKAKDFGGYILEPALAAYNAVAAEILDRTAKTGNAVSFRDYHTTLLFAAFKKFGFGHFIASFWIGDGGLALYGPNGADEVDVLGVPDSGEFAGQTRFLTMGEEFDPEKASVNPLDRVRFSFPRDFEALILASDGVTDPFFPSEASILSFEEWNKFWNLKLNKGSKENPGCGELFDGSSGLDLVSKKLLDWLNFWVVGEHDDRTILIVKKHPHGVKLEEAVPRPGEPGPEADAGCGSDAAAGQTSAEGSESAPAGAPSDPQAGPDADAAGKRLPHEEAGCHPGGTLSGEPEDGGAVPDGAASGGVASARAVTPPDSSTGEGSDSSPDPTDAQDDYGLKRQDSKAPPLEKDYSQREGGDPAAVAPPGPPEPESSALSAPTEAGNIPADSEAATAVGRADGEARSTGDGPFEKNDPSKGENEPPEGADGPD